MARGEQKTPALTPEQRTALLDYYRKEPPQAKYNQEPSQAVFNRAAIALRLPGGGRRARQAWTHGWPQQNQPPMREQVLREQASSRFLKARLDMSAELADVYDAAAKDALAQRALEAHGARLLSGMVDSVVAEFATTAAVVLRRALQVIVQTPPATIREAQEQVTTVTRAAAQVTAMKAESMKVERLAAGEPTEIMELAVPEPTTLDEIEAEIQAAQRALQYAREEAQGRPAAPLTNGTNGTRPGN